MIKEIINGISFILKLIVKAMQYTLKGIIWFFTNLDLVVRDFKINNKKETKIVKKEEIL